MINILDHFNTKNQKKIGKNCFGVKKDFIQNIHHKLAMVRPKPVFMPSLKLHNLFNSYRPASLGAVTICYRPIQL